MEDRVIRPRTHYFLLAALAAVLLGMGLRSAQAAPADPCASPDEDHAAVMNQVQLAAAIAQHWPGIEVLDQMPKDARDEFMSSLRFGDKGLSGFTFRPLVDYLPRAQACRLMRLFGAQHYIAGLRGWQGVTATGQGSAEKPSAMRARITAALDAWDWQLVEQIRKEPLGAELLGGAQMPRRVIADASLAGKPNAWRFDFLEQTLVQHPIDTGTRLVLVFHPGCGYCQRMAEDMQANSRMSAVLAGCGSWLTFSDGNFDMRAFERWFEKHPAFKPLLVRDWSSLSLEQPTGTPTLYVYANGRRRATIVGWPGAARIDEVLKAVAEYDPAGRCSAH